MSTQGQFDRLFGLIERQINSGELRPGDRLLSRSKMAKTYEVSKATVQRVVWILRDRGMVRGQQGSAVYVVGPDPRRGGVERGDEGGAGDTRDT